jgi:ferredoxin
MSNTEVDAGGTATSTLKVTVDNSLCQGHARCWHIAPEFFTLDEDGYSSIGTGKPVPVGSEEVVRAGVAACPERALTIEESA